MKDTIGSLFRRFVAEESKREIQEELDFHVDLLTQEHLQPGVSLTEAKHAARKRFGNIELIKDQCLDITSRSHPLLTAVKSFLILMFLVGVLLRVTSTVRNITHVGDLLIVVASLCRLLLYVRGWNPSPHPSDRETESQLMLNEQPQPPFTIYDHRKLTPVERVISDE